MALRRHELRRGPCAPGAPEGPGQIGLAQGKKVAHYYLSVDALRQPMKVREDSPPFGSETS